MISFKQHPMVSTAVLVGLFASLGIHAKTDLFAPDEKLAIQQFWFAKGRYALEPGNPSGPFQVRLTPEASRWLLGYNKARGISKGQALGTSVVATGQSDPTSFLSPNPPANPYASWEAWVDAKVSYDRYVAAVECEQLNAKLAGRQPVLPAPVADPGPAPLDLIASAGEPPVFAAKVRPMRHQVSLGDYTVSYVDNVDMRPKYAYYRWQDGVMARGTSVKQIDPNELNELFSAAGINESTRKIFQAVSMLEGGFDSINTYDTGFVSVGLIQFACLEAGSGSLASVLQEEKRNFPADFNSDFRRFGVEVDERGSIVVVSPTDFREMVGPDAAKEIIYDKRLAAIFSRAGALSPSFKIAQLRVAKSRYFPADDQVTIQLGGRAVSVRVGDVVRSEAGLATLMDRKVNTGNLGNFKQVLQSVADQVGAASISDLAKNEQQIVEQVQFRKRFIGDPTLGQPGTVAALANKTSFALPGPKVLNVPVVAPLSSESLPTVDVVQALPKAGSTTRPSGKKQKTGGLPTQDSPIGKRLA